MSLSGLPRPVPPGQRQLVVLAVEGHRSVPRHHLAEDLNPLSRPCQRLRIRLAVPPFHHLRPGNADAEDQAAVRDVIQRRRLHGGTGRRAGRNLHDGRAEIDALGVRANPRQRREAVGTVDFRAPDGVVAKRLRLLRRLDDSFAPRRPQRANAHTQLHPHLHLAQFAKPASLHDALEGRHSAFPNAQDGFVLWQNVSGKNELGSRMDIRGGMG